MGIDSSKPKKQKSFFHNMPLHRKQKDLAANLSKAIRKSLGRRALPVRKGDKVKVIRGSRKGFEGKVTRTNYNKGQVFLEKLSRKKSDGTETLVPLHASNLMIVDVDKSDVRRIGKEKGVVKEKAPAKAVAKEQKGMAPTREAKKEKSKGEDEKEKTVKKEKKGEKDGKKR